MRVHDVVLHIQKPTMRGHDAVSHVQKSIMRSHDAVLHMQKPTMLRTMSTIGSLVIVLWGV